MISQLLLLSRPQIWTRVTTPVLPSIISDRLFLKPRGPLKKSLCCSAEQYNLSENPRETQNFQRLTVGKQLDRLFHSLGLWATINLELNTDSGQDKRRKEKTRHMRSGPWEEVRTCTDFHEPKINQTICRPIWSTTVLCKLPPMFSLRWGAAI